MPRQLFTTNGSWDPTGKQNITGTITMDAGEAVTFAVDATPLTLEISGDSVFLYDSFTAGLLVESNEGGVTEDDYGWVTGDNIIDGGAGTSVEFRYDPLDILDISGAHQIVLTADDLAGTGDGVYKFPIAGVSNLVIVADSGYLIASVAWILPISDLSFFEDGLVYISIGDGVGTTDVGNDVGDGFVMQNGDGSVTQDDAEWHGSPNSSSAAVPTVTIYYDKIASGGKAGRSFFMGI